MIDDYVFRSPSRSPKRLGEDTPALPVPKGKTGETKIDDNNVFVQEIEDESVASLPLN